MIKDAYELAFQNKMVIFFIFRTYLFLCLKSIFFKINFLFFVLQIIFLYFKIVLICIVKNNFKKLKKYYFNIFLNKKSFKNQLIPHN